jgi:hypothetical protein
MSVIDRKNLRSLRRYAGRLNRVIEEGAFDAMDPRKRGRLVRRVRELYGSLAGVVAEPVLRGILAAAAVVVLGLAGCAKSEDPYYDTGTDTAWDTLVGDTLADTAGDTILDPDADPPADTGWDTIPDTAPDTITDTGWDTGLDTRPDTPTDIGTDDGTDACLFAASRRNPFGFTGLSSYFLFTAFADIDGDGDLDLFGGVYSYYGSTGIAYWRNTGTRTSPTFGSHVMNPFGFTSSYTMHVPAFADLDGDGDSDMLVAAADYYGSAFRYYRNTGTTTSPAFASPLSNPFGLSAPTGGYVMPIALVDIDDDGDMDLFVSVYPSTGTAGLDFYRNTGSSTSPAFAAPSRNPFGLTATSYVASPAFADIDDDGDMDLVRATYDAFSTRVHFVYNENTGTATSPAFASALSDPFCLGWTSSYMSTLSVADIDGDGDPDLFAGDYSYSSLTGILYFENISTP